MKKLLSVSLAVAMMFVLTACTNGNNSSSVDSSNVEASSSEVIEKTTITDRYGNEIEIPDTIKRIVCTAASNTEILVELGLGEEIVVMDSYTEMLDGLNKDVKKVDFYELNIESLVEAKPDLIVASEINMRGEEDPYAQLKELGATVIYIPTATTVDDIIKDITFLGEFTKTSDKAKEITDAMTKKIDEIKSIAKTITDKKSVYFEIDIAPNIYTLGKGTFINEAIDIIGATNVFGDQEGWIALSEEQILQANPDVILTNVNYIENPIDELKSRKAWNNIDAVKNDKVYSVSTNASSRATHNFIIALEEMAKAVYPEFYK